MIPLLTARLILRAWRPEDRVPFAAISADPEVMRFYPKVLNRAESDAAVDRFTATLAAHRMTIFAAEEQASGRLIGGIGIKPVPDRLPVAPAVELGWRVAADCWGNGYAPEGARAVLRLAFEELRLTEVIALTSTVNAPSRRVMEKLSMVRDAASDFDHPDIPDGHPLRRHVVYRLSADEWRRSVGEVEGAASPA